MQKLPNCPKCNSPYTYEDMSLLICPECAHEWSKECEDEQEIQFSVKDANGTTLYSGDDVTVIKDLKVKGSSSVVKVGTKIKGIKLIQSHDDHNIDCKIPGIGAIVITSKFVKKS